MTEQDENIKEITELAECIYNLNLGRLAPEKDIQAIKHNIQSFLLANRYAQLDEDQTLPELDIATYNWREPSPHYVLVADTIIAYEEAQKDMLKQGWRKVKLEVIK